MGLRAEDVVRSRSDVVRPIITRLNNDNSWLLSIPRAEGPRLFYNILIDPWLVGSDVNGHRFFHEQHHGEEPAAKSIADVEKFLGDVEQLARKYRTDVPDAANAPAPTSWIDVVSMSIYGGDHTNEPTLKQVPAGVPIFAYDPQAVKQVKGWKHFDTVVKTPNFQGSWTDVHLSPLPEHISISMFTPPKDFFGLHFGLVVAFQVPSLDGTKGTAGTDTAECIFHTPHGPYPQDIAPLVKASPPLKVLSLLHGCLKVDFGFGWAKSTANMGAHNGLELTRLLNSKYWLQTHDEHKVEKGLTSWTLTHEWQSVDDAAAACAAKSGEDKNEILKKANYHDLGNGGSLVLA